MFAMDKTPVLSDMVCDITVILLAQMLLPSNQLVMKNLTFLRALLQRRIVQNYFQWLP